MRYGVLWSWDFGEGGPPYDQNARADILSVTTGWDRDFFFQLFAIGSTQARVYVYDTRAQAEGTGTTWLARSALFTWTGIEQDVALTFRTGATFDPTPMTIRCVVNVTGGGVSPLWSTANIYWVADVESLLVERIQDTLQLYCASNEALAALSVETADILANPFASTPTPPPIIVEINLDAPSASREFGNQGFEDVVAVTLVGRCLHSNPDTARETAAHLATTLRAIAMSQRTWGGLAIETTIGQSMRPSVSSDETHGWTATCEVPLAVQIPGWAPALDSGYPIGWGGKYRSPATTGNTASTLAAIRAARVVDTPYPLET